MELIEKVWNYHFPAFLSSIKKFSVVLNRAKSSSMEQKNKTYCIMKTGETTGESLGSKSVTAMLIGPRLSISLPRRWETINCTITTDLGEDGARDEAALGETEGQTDSSRGGGDVKGAEGKIGRDARCDCSGVCLLETGLHITSREARGGLYLAHWSVMWGKCSLPQGLFRRGVSITHLEQ